jgi:N-acetylated-alpha-linked acidic dipeptidase
MRRWIYFLSTFIFLLTAFPQFTGAQKPSQSQEAQWEEKFRAIPDPNNLREYMRRLSARPHHVGSAYDKDNAEWILAKFKSFGLDAHIETFDVLYPTPKVRLVEMTEPTHFTAKLQEPALAVDPTSNQQSEQLPTFHAYSIDGDVTAPLVYVNYGIPEDYDRLERLGISVKGAIVIAKYGHSWRGIKPKVAAEHGAIGCLVYSDPHDDGYAQDEVFPNGPMRPKDGVQRGSVADMPLYPGDPLTPGVGSVPGAKRLALKDAPTLTKIPVLPISYGDAEPLLAALTGPVAPSEWRGALPITYHIGPGPAKVHLKLQSNWDTKTIYDVIARIPGSQDPNQWVIRGNHPDAWVNGAEDPTSGQVALIEEARAFGELLKQGWRPKRTIIYCAWDGEEPGLLGSTEWVETHAEELTQHAVVYINSDSNGRGFLSVEGSHTLEKFINGVARDVQDPETKLSAWKRNQLAKIANAKGEHRGDSGKDATEERKEARERADLRIPALGSGSDYSAFLQHLGIASLNIAYGGEDDGGIYHSIYDDFYWYTHFSDKDFVYGRALAQTVGTAVLRLADDDVLPFDFTDLADTVQMYAKELKALYKQKQESARERALELKEGAFEAVSDPRRPLLPPKEEQIPPSIDFSALDDAAKALTDSADRYQKAATAMNSIGDAASHHALNQKLMESERRFTNSDGLPRRPWFKHLLYAPGFYTGYGVKTVPGVREALEQGRYDEAQSEIARVAKVLQNETALIDSAISDLSKTAH